SGERALREPAAGCRGVSILSPPGLTLTRAVSPCNAEDRRRSWLAGRHLRRIDVDLAKRYDRLQLLDTRGGAELQLLWTQNDVAHGITLDQVRTTRAAVSGIPVCHVVEPGRRVECFVGMPIDA